MIDRRAKARLKGEKLQARMKIFDSILRTLQQLQTEVTKTSERISSFESLFEQHSRTFAPSHPTLDDQISLLAYSDGELLDYSQDEVSLAAGPQDQAIQPYIIRLLSHHTRPLGHHTRQVSHKHLRNLNQMDRLVITLSLPRHCTTPIQQNDHGNLKRNYPRSKRYSFAENSPITKYVKSLTMYSVPLVDCLVQRALLNTTGPYMIPSLQEIKFQQRIVNAYLSKHYASLVQPTINCSCYVERKFLQILMKRE